MINIIKQEIKISSDLKNKIDWACKLTSTSANIINGNLIILEPTNIAYIEPHIVTINNTLYLFFNEQDFVYINDLSSKIKISDLVNHIRKVKN